jgi:hypothetical protein
MSLWKSTDALRRASLEPRRPHRPPPPAATGLSGSFVLLTLLAAVLSGVAGHGARAGQTDELALDGRALPAHAASSAGGGFVLDGVATVAPLAQSGTFELLPPGALGSPRFKSADSCFCGPIFADGFESGNVNAWNSSGP